MSVPTRNIIFFSRPIRSGKTTELKAFISGRQHVGGFLTPDEGERRVLYVINTGITAPFELDEHAAEPVVAVGRFHFAAAAFEQGQRLLLEPDSCDWLIVDEVGKLEVNRHAGFEPALMAVIEAYKKRERTGRLLLVVRDSLLEEAIRKYGLEAAQVVHSLEDL